MKFDDTLNVKRCAFSTYKFSETFWEATREKRLLMQFCPQSQQYQFFPRPVSIATGSTNLEWKEVDGVGEIYTYSLMNLGIGPFQGSEPYPVIIARLDIGVDIISNLVNGDADDLVIGRRIKPYWLPIDDGRHFLLFQPEKS